MGIAGIMGSGREMLVPLITGQTPIGGSVAVDDTEIENYSRNLLLMLECPLTDIRKAIEYEFERCETHFST